MELLGGQRIWAPRHILLHVWRWSRLRSLFWKGYLAGGLSHQVVFIKVKKPKAAYSNIHSASYSFILCPAMPSSPRSLAVAAGQWYSMEGSSSIHLTSQMMPLINPSQLQVMREVCVCFWLVWVRKYHPNMGLHMALHLMKTENLFLIFDVSWKIVFLTGRLGCGKYRKHEYSL